MELKNDCSLSPTPNIDNKLNDDLKKINCKKNLVNNKYKFR